MALSEELKSLGEKVKDLTIESEIQLTQMRRAELISKRRQLMSEELTKWQRIQSDKELEDSKHNIASKPTFFNRTRYLDPLRDRLASSLFLNVTLRSEDGRRALRDMIALCTEKVEVAYRPSSHPENGCCPVCGQEMDRIEVDKRWSHILRCLTESLTSKYGFAELCFQCDQWVTSADAWSSHCQSHLDDVDSLPIQLNPITFRKTLATVCSELEGAYQ
ncbi:hypothetical protein F5884DRAFT_535563 [Xylogone sp. PMI_703]|nr:hypothetical protein F5884DRAFT_535563 [Xylogone sp. PMI_703]